MCGLSVTSQDFLLQFPEPTLRGPLLLFYSLVVGSNASRGRMSRFGGNGQLSRSLRLLGLGAGCLALANCANGNMSSRVEHHQKIRTADRASIQYVTDTTNNNDPAAVVGGRPTNCPRSFCGCEASRYLFGHVRADLNLASNWMRKFPRTTPAPGMAAVRNHHVFVLMSHVDGNNWVVHDGNSGQGLTREHVRSISGYTVVNPQGTGIATPLLARAE
jgi:hypothetical protein